MFEAGKCWDVAGINKHLLCGSILHCLTSLIDMHLTNENTQQLNFDVKKTNS